MQAMNHAEGKTKLIKVAVSSDVIHIKSSMKHRNVDTPNKFVVIGKRKIRKVN